MHDLTQEHLHIVTGSLGHWRRKLGHRMMDDLQDDIRQEAMIAASECVETWKPDGGNSLRTYMITAINFRVMAMLRSHKLKVVPYMAVEPDSPIFTNRLADDNSPAFTEDEKWQLWNKVKVVCNEREARILWQLFVEHKQQKEVAKIESLSHQRIQQILQTSLKKLRECCEMRQFMAA